MTLSNEAVEAAARETARLRHELDITNADHIALWIEANTIPDEPMSQCASWLACRIVEAHEAALTAALPIIRAQVLEEAAKERDALRMALSNAIAMIGHKMPMNATALVAGETLIAGDVWKAGVDALKENHP